MPTKRTRTNGISKQTAQNMLDIARMKKIKISELEEAIGVKSTGLSRIARDTAGHRLYAQDVVFAAKFLNVTMDDIINWHETPHALDEFRVKSFLLRAAEDTEKKRLKWSTCQADAGKIIYKSNIADDAILGVDTDGLAWIETENTTCPITNQGDTAALTLLSTITRPPKLTKHAVEIIDKFMSE